MPKIRVPPKPEGGSLEAAKLRTDDAVFRVGVELKSFETTFYDRGKLPVGEPIPGPAIILQVDSTTVVPPECMAEVHESGSIILKLPPVRPTAEFVQSFNEVTGERVMRSKIVPGLILVVMSGAPGRVVAQQAALEEIVVTATRREERLQDVAISATVFSGEDLQALRVLEPHDLAEQTPGLLAKYGPNGLATVGFYMRGVGINDFTGTVDPSVGIYVDEVFQPTPDMLNFAVYDIARVEVLRGPQGTLYGSNSTGGAINFITAKPTEEFEGFAAPGTAATTRTRRPAR